MVVIGYNYKNFKIGRLKGIKDLFPTQHFETHRAKHKNNNQLS